MRNTVNRSLGSKKRECLQISKPSPQNQQGYPLSTGPLHTDTSFFLFRTPLSTKRLLSKFMLRRTPSLTDIRHRCCQLVLSFLQTVTFPPPPYTLQSPYKRESPYRLEPPYEDYSNELCTGHQKWIRQLLQLFRESM